MAGLWPDTFDPSQGPDGRWLYFTRDREIWRMPTGGGPEERVTSGLSGVLNLVVGRTHLYCTAADRSRLDTRIDAVDLRTGTQSTIARLGRPPSPCHRTNARCSCRLSTPQAAI